jgi:hypothetical protein
MKRILLCLMFLLIIVFAAFAQGAAEYGSRFTEDRIILELRDDWSFSMAFEKNGIEYTGSFGTNGFSKMLWLFCESPVQRTFAFRWDIDGKNSSRTLILWEVEDDPKNGDWLEEPDPNNKLYFNLRDEGR